MTEPHTPPRTRETGKMLRLYLGAGGVLFLAVAAFFWIRDGAGLMPLAFAAVGIADLGLAALMGRKVGKGR